jgi:hypothetical protein
MCFGAGNRLVGATNNKIDFLANTNAPPIVRGHRRPIIIMFIVDSHPVHHPSQRGIAETLRVKMILFGQLLSRTVDPDATNPVTASDTSDERKCYVPSIERAR